MGNGHRLAGGGVIGRAGRLRAGKSGSGHDRPDPPGGVPAFAGDGHAEPPDRRDRPAPDQLAGDGAGQPVDPFQVQRVGPGQRARRSGGRHRPRLGVHRCQHGDAGPARDAAACAAQGVDAGHQRRGGRRGGLRQDRIQGRPGEVEGQAEGQDRLHRCAAPVQAEREVGLQPPRPRQPGRAAVVSAAAGTQQRSGNDGALPRAHGAGAADQPVPDRRRRGRHRLHQQLERRHRARDGRRLAQGRRIGRRARAGDDGRALQHGDACAGPQGNREAAPERGRPLPR